MSAFLTQEQIDAVDDETEANGDDNDPAAESNASMDINAEDNVGATMERVQRESERLRIQMNALRQGLRNTKAIDGTPTLPLDEVARSIARSKTSKSALNVEGSTAGAGSIRGSKRGKPMTQTSFKSASVHEAGASAIEEEGSIGGESSTIGSIQYPVAVIENEDDHEEVEVYM